MNINLIPYLFFFFLLQFQITYLLFIIVLLVFFIKTLLAKRLLINNVSKRRKKNDVELSIIMPVHNEEKNLKIAIDSLYNKSYNFELIVVNDCSNDTSLDILNNLKKKYGFKIITCKKQQYVNQVLNIGLSETSKESNYIAVINADCIISNNWFSILSNKLKNYEIEVINFSNHIKTIANNKSLEKKICYYSVKMEKSFKNYLFEYVESSLNNGYVINRKILESCKGWETITEDLNLNLKIKKLGYKVYQEPEIKIFDSYPNSFLKLLTQKYRWIYGDVSNRLEYFPKNLFDIVVNAYYFFPLFTLLSFILPIYSLFILKLQFIILTLESFLYLNSKKISLFLVLESCFYTTIQFIFNLYFYIKYFFSFILQNNKKIKW
jgi:glycosyltransferase involved in cell wall biosynthesis